MPEHRDQDPIGVARIDEDGGNLLAVPQTEVLPGLTAVRGLVDAVAGRKIGTLQPLAAADIEDIRVRGGDRDGSDGAGRLVVEDGVPGPAVIVRLPDTAVIDADVKDVRLSRQAGRPNCSAAAERPDHAPAEAVVELRIERLRLGRDD